MTSREECHRAYVFIGYTHIHHVPMSMMMERIEQVRRRLGSNITDSQKSLLIDVGRCNAICDDTDSEEVCHDKFSQYFDRVEAYERCGELSKKLDPDFYDFVFVLKSADVVLNNVYSYIPSPIIVDSYVYAKLVKEGYTVHPLSEMTLITNPKKQIILPDWIDSKILIYLLSPEIADYLIWQVVDTLEIDDQLAVTMNGKIGVTKPIWGYWGYFPYKRYACYTSPDFDEWDFVV